MSKVATPAMNDLLRRSVSNNTTEAAQASHQLFAELGGVIREGIMAGDIVSGIYQNVPFAPGAEVEFPLHYLAPGTEKDFVAYTIPRHGYIPQRTIEGDYVKVPTYAIGNSIDWLIKYARDARWDIVSAAMQTLKDGVIQKKNTDGWNTLLTAGVDRNVVVFDSDAGAGQFTKRLISLMKVIMRRNGGGNSTSMNRSRLTDLYLSPECMEDIANWGVDQIDEVTRREFYLREDGGVKSIFSVNLHDIDELGESQQFQTYYTGQLAGTLAASDVELLVGLDLSKANAFVSPVVAPGWEQYDDPALLRHQKQGVFGWTQTGFACLDGRRIILGSC